MKNNVVLYAPNIHTGGGMVLLDELLDNYPENENLIAFLDERSRERINLKNNVNVFWVNPSLKSRLTAEVNLKRVTKQHHIVICFHGLPPMLPILGNVIIYLQNRNYIGKIDLGSFPLKVRIRLFIERTISRFFKKRVMKYIVQTPSMKRTLQLWYKGLSNKEEVEIDIFPFFNGLHPDKKYECEPIIYDFIYVADGVAHKNHKNLLEAWVLLAKNGFFPSLILTLGERDKDIIKNIDLLKDKYGLNILNLGHLKHTEITQLYLQSKALIFPSFSESFGLPLLEASNVGLDILAGELDFVRDVCKPVETFNPESSISIYKCILRYLDVESKSYNIYSSLDFWNKYTH